MERIRQLLIGGGAVAQVLPETVMRAFHDLFGRQALNSGALAIQGAASPGARTTATVNALVQGRLVQIAAGNMPALTGFSLTANQFGAVLFTVDGSGTVRTLVGGAAPNAAGVQFPIVPADQTCFGALVITSTGAFTGGTTALDAGGVTVQYLNIVGPNYPINTI